MLLAFGDAVFFVVRSLALLRIEGRIDERLQAASWGRLLALPASFFRRFTAGNLAALGPPVQAQAPAYLKPDRQNFCRIQRGSVSLLRRGRSRSTCIANGRLRYTGKNASRRAPPCVVSRV